MFGSLISIAISDLANPFSRRVYGYTARNKDIDSWDINHFSRPVKLAAKIADEEEDLKAYNVTADEDESLSNTHAKQINLSDSIILTKTFAGDKSFTGKAVTIVVVPEMVRLRIMINDDHYIEDDITHAIGETVGTKEKKQAESNLGSSQLENVKATSETLEEQAAPKKHEHDLPKHIVYQPATPLHEISKSDSTPSALAKKEESPTNEEKSLEFSEEDFEEPESTPIPPTIRSMYRRLSIELTEENLMEIATQEEEIITESSPKNETPKAANIEKIRKLLITLASNIDTINKDDRDYNSDNDDELALKDKPRDYGMEMVYEEVELTNYNTDEKDEVRTLLTILEDDIDDIKKEEIDFSSDNEDEIDLNQTVIKRVRKLDLSEKPNDYWLDMVCEEATLTNYDENAALFNDTRLMGLSDSVD